ncbi:type II secretion system protein [Pontiella sp.]|uniref:type II secretion system protein n=1 Tax=Pontiella sp. TaxID=2837462 RepID=UPI0035651D92
MLIYTHMFKNGKVDAFTLIEIVIVVAILGIVAAIGLPTVLHAGTSARSKQFAHDINVATQAFMQYSLDSGGSYPGDQLPGELPEGMSGYLNERMWTGETSIGGYWDWDYEVFGITAAVSVKDPNWSDQQMTEIDGLLDDGDLGSGSFRKRSQGYMFVIE